VRNRTLHWAVIPAAGVGSRMNSDTPKQYLPLANSTIIEKTLSQFINHPLIDGIVLSISEGDEYWPEIQTRLTNTAGKPIIVAKGGKERSDSVLSALLLLKKQTQEDVWVFVHDAARPCLLATDIDKLINNLSGNDAGVLLGVPIIDTLKRSNVQHQVEKTVARDLMWRALTPQVFKLQVLIEALQTARLNEHVITDESSAMELLGFKPKLIEGDSNNIKITRSSDLEQAENYLSNNK